MRAFRYIKWLPWMVLCYQQACVRERNSWRDEWACQGVCVWGYIMFFSLCLSPAALWLQLPLKHPQTDSPGWQQLWIWSLSNQGRCSQFLKKGLMIIYCSNMAQQKNRAWKGNQSAALGFPHVCNEAGRREDPPFILALRTEHKFTAW